MAQSGNNGGRISRGGTAADRQALDDAQARAAQTAAETTERAEKLGDDVDTILDEIDDVLETNAEVFVRDFVQKGGQ